MLPHLQTKFVIYISMFFILIFSVLSDHAYGKDQYRGTGIADLLENMTREQVRKKAFERAMNNALAKAGIEVTSVDGLSRMEREEGEMFENFIQFTFTRTNGLITEIDTLIDEIQSVDIPGGKPILQHRVEINAKILIEKEEADPEFQINMAVNEDIFREGDPVHIQLNSTKDCYVTIFNLYSNDSLLIIFPNSEMEDNFIGENDTLRIPPKDAFWDLPAGLLPGHDTSVEALVAIATKKRIPIQLEGIAMRNGLISQNDALLTINRWRGKIGISDRTEAWCFYRIIK